VKYLNGGITILNVKSQYISHIISYNKTVNLLLNLVIGCENDSVIDIVSEEGVFKLKKFKFDKDFILDFAKLK
jgi:hypothetical protein